LINRDKIREAIEFAREFNLKTIEVDGIKFEIPATNPKDEVTGLDETEVLKSLDILDNFTDDEILFWATPYYDELQAQKELKQQIANEQNEVSDNGD